MKKYKVLWIFLTCAALALASLLVQNNYLISRTRHRYDRELRGLSH